MEITPIDWTSLRAAAFGATTNSYAPYSKLQVGVAALLADGRIITGCNVENASFGLTFCAEVTMIGRLRMEGVSPMVALAATDQFRRQLTPCGRCRQILMEHGGPDLVVDGPTGPRPMRELLPDWFGPDELPSS